MSKYDSLMDYLDAQETDRSESDSQDDHRNNNKSNETGSRSRNSGDLGMFIKSIY
jgi:hypothetical protein